MKFTNTVKNLIRENKISSYLAVGFLLLVMPFPWLVPGASVSFVMLFMHLMAGVLSCVMLGFGLYHFHKDTMRRVPGDKKRWTAADYIYVSLIHLAIGVVGVMAPCIALRVLCELIFLAVPSFPLYSPMFSLGSIPTSIIGCAIICTAAMLWVTYLALLMERDWLQIKMDVNGGDRRSKYDQRTPGSCLKECGVSTICVLARFALYVEGEQADSSTASNIGRGSATRV